jgi:hypothetical protein
MLKFWNAPFLQDNEGMENALRTLDGVPLKGLDVRLEKVAIHLGWKLSSGCGPN